MGCGSHKLSVTPEQAKRIADTVRAKHGGKVLLVSIKDQNRPGKVYLCGNASGALVEEFTKILQGDENNKTVMREKDKYDMMWDECWRNTSITTGWQALSFSKSYFPRGKLVVQLLDCLARHGWTLAACPNFGGVESRDDNGSVASTVSWPVFVFYQDTNAPLYNPTHLLLAVKDSNVPGKLCAAGPVGELEAAMTEAMKTFAEKVESKKDEYDTDFDVVWRETSITSGMCMVEKSYFPKGKVVSAMLQCCHKHGWRVVGCPNFGGQGDSWPSFVLRQLKDPSSDAGELVFMSLKDTNVPGKLCLSGSGVPAVQSALVQALSQVKGNETVQVKCDQYDGDQDAVIHNVNITTGGVTFACHYFPRCDTVMTLLDTMTAKGFSCMGCPNFGGKTDSWPCFIFQTDPNPSPAMCLAVKDDSIPGKLNLGGGGLASNPALAEELLQALQGLCQESVKQIKDPYDETFDICFKDTKITTGAGGFTLTSVYFPHGYVLDAVLHILMGHGWVAVGGPNFGANGDSWPCIIFKAGHKLIFRPVDGHFSSFT